MIDHIYKQTLFEMKGDLGKMEVPYIILPTQHMGQNGLVPVDQVQMTRWTPIINNAI